MSGIKYLPVWCDYGDDQELNSVIISREDEDDIREAIAEAKDEVVGEDPYWCIDDIIDRVCEKIDVIDAKKLRGVAI